jgi:hypothetical protein
MQNMNMQDQLASVGGGKVACGVSIGILAIAVCDPVLWPALIASGEMIAGGVAAACLS